MKYAVLNDREISASDLSVGMYRSNDYNCLFCSSEVYYVKGSEQASAHFRHKSGESCINDNSLKRVLEEEAILRIENKKSKFHQWWQSRFPKESTEVRMTNEGKVHIADIFLKFDNPICLSSDDNHEVFKEPLSNLIIEIQHSNIPLRDVECRNRFYTKSNPLLWIFDISGIDHKIESFITLTQNKTKILFPDRQHSGLLNAIQCCKRYAYKNDIRIVLDNGVSLFKIVLVYLDIDFMLVEPISKRKFLNELGACQNDIEKGVLQMEERIYSDVISLLNIEYQVDIDEVFNMIEDIPIKYLRDGCSRFANKAYKTYIEMICSWVSIMSNKNPFIFKILDKWVEQIKHKYYNREALRFGKYNGVALNKLPISYIKWIIEKDNVRDEDLLLKLKELFAIDNIRYHYENPGSLVYYRKCRDSFYRTKWDKRTLEDRYNVLESILKRPWITHIEEVQPDKDGYVELERCLAEILPVDNNYTVIKKDEKYYYRFKPIKVKDVYLAISAEDLLEWYGVIDEHYGYNHKTKAINWKNIQKHFSTDCLID